MAVVLSSTGAFTALLLIAGLIYDLRQAQAPAAIEAPSILSEQAPALAPDPPAATTPSTFMSAIAVPGAAFIDATGETPGERARRIVPVWPAAHPAGGEPTCALLHGGDVEVRDATTDGAGSRWYNVRRHDCAGWIEGRFLSPTGVDPSDPAATPVPSSH